jgi:replication factor C subunit 3/5
LYDDDVNNLKKITYNVNGSSTKKEIEIMQSNHHVVIEPTNTNHDKYILQEIIKQYAMHKSFNVFKTNRNFKTILIYNIETLAINSQAALRRTMEKFATTCRFVMVCNNLSKLFEPLRSRCRVFCTPLPSMTDIERVICNISLYEKISINKNDIEFILKNCDRKLKKAIWLLDSKRLNCPSIITLDEILVTVVDLIFQATVEKSVIDIFNNDIRTHIYNILITNIKGTDIITSLLDLILERVNDLLSIKIIEHASDAEYNLIHGRRDILHIDSFIINVMNELILNPTGIIKLNKLKSTSVNSVTFAELPTVIANRDPEIKKKITKKTPVNNKKKNNNGSKTSKKSR